MNDSQTPLYLAALKANNSPAETWGPRRKANQTGVYAHLNSGLTGDNIFNQQRSSKRSSVVQKRIDTTTGTTNPTFDSSTIISNENEIDLDTRF